MKSVQLHVSTVLLMLFLLCAGGCRSHKPKESKPAPPPPKEYIEIRFPSGEIVEESIKEDKKDKDNGNITVSARKIVAEARKWLGTPYKYGGNSKKGTDCSGMVMKVFESKGIKLPRDSRSQQQHCLAIDKSSLQPGDLVFFASSVGGSRISHVGIYVGDDKFIHSSTSRGVITSSMSEDYYRRHYHSSGRVPEVNGKAPKGEDKKIAKSEEERNKLSKAAQNKKTKKKSSKKKKSKKKSK